MPMIFFSVFAKKTLANVGSNDDPMAVGIIYLCTKTYLLQLYVKVLQRYLYHRGVRLGFLQKKIVSAINRIIFFSGTLVNQEVTLKLTNF